MVTMNKIHYAVQIKTGTQTTDAEIGMFQGNFNFTTEGYAPTNLDEYENHDPVIGTWYGDMLSLKGIKPSNQTIDIVSSGNYAYLSSLDVELVNFNGLHKKILTTTELYILGSTMNLYVIIDGVWYPRWSGTVAEYSFDEETFKFIGKDRNNTENNTINDYVFGYNNTAYVPVISNEKALLDHRFIKNYEPTANNITMFDSKEGGMGETPDYRGVDAYYVGGGAKSYYTIDTGNRSFFLRLNGHETSVLVGMYVKIGSEESYHYIENVEFLEEVVTDMSTKKYTQLTIIDASDTITDYSVFYGYQPTGVDTLIPESASKYDAETVLCSIYSKGLRFAAINSGYDVVDGKVKATTKDGDSIEINVAENPDGSLTLLQTNYTKVRTPSRILYWGETNNSPGSFIDNLHTGKATHLEQYGTTVNNLGQNLSALGPWRGYEGKLSHFFMLEFDEDVSEEIPFVVVSALVDSYESWQVGFTDNNIPAVISKLRSTLEQGVVNTYNSAFVDTEIKSINSMFRNFDIDVYRITEDKEFGLMPLLDANATFVLPNCRKRGNLYSRNGLEIDVETYSSPVTNLPLTSITGPTISTDNLIANWATQFDSANKTTYPDSKIAYITESKAVTSSRRILIEISASNNSANVEGDLSVRYLNTTYTPDLAAMVLGLNSIGVYKKYEITSVEDLTIKTSSATTGTLPKLLSNLTGTNVSLPTRDSWFVGGQISTETNKFGLVTSLCNKSMLGGFTDRGGSVKFKAFIEDSSTNHTHNSENIIENSISAFKLSPIEKCYNEFTVKFNQERGEFTKEYGVYHVDSASFPLQSEIDPVWGTTTALAGGTGNALYMDHPSYTGRTWVLVVDDSEITVLSDLLGDPMNLFKIGTYNPFGTYEPFICTNVEFIENVAGDNFFYVDYVTGYDGGAIAIETFSANQNEEGILWKTFVTGVDSYSDAKQFWEEANLSWLLNKRIRVAPAEITELTYAIGRNSFYGVSTYNNTEEYAYEYFSQLIDWSTRQKLQVSYSLPITTETIGMELLDSVKFEDAIITPEVGEFGKGWITSIQLNPAKYEFKVSITFEPQFLIPPSAIPPIMNIIETGFNLIDIVETGSNPVDIVEV